MLETDKIPPAAEWTVGAFHVLRRDEGTEDQWQIDQIVPASMSEDELTLLATAWRLAKSRPGRQTVIVHLSSKTSHNLRYWESEDPTDFTTTTLKQFDEAAVAPTTRERTQPSGKSVVIKDFDNDLEQAAFIFMAAIIIGTGGPPVVKYDEAARHAYEAARAFRKETLNQTKSGSE